MGGVSLNVLDGLPAEAPCLASHEYRLIHGGKLARL
jgi:hypothetical protein